MACFHHAAVQVGAGRAASSAFAEPGVEPHYGPSWAFRVDHVHVTIRIEPEARRYEGTSRFTVTGLPAFRGEVALDLDGVEVLAVQVDEAPATFRRGHGTVIVSNVPAQAVVTVTYRGGEPGVGLYFVGPTPGCPSREPMAWTQCQDEDAHFFMPCLDHPRAKHPWTIELIGPEGYELLSNGRCVEDTTVDGWRRTRWEQAEPMPAYLFTAVVAPLDVVTAEGSVPLRYLVPRGRRADALRAMGRTPEMIALFEEKTGYPFPWPRYDQVVVHDFVFGGMENIACTTMTEALLVDEKVGPHYDPDVLVAHELAHQWFGDLVTCRDWSQAWLNESFATFMELVWWEHARSREEAEWYAFSLCASYLTEDSGRYRRPITSYDFREPIDVFDRHLYEKGAAVLHTLRRELGCEAFWLGIGRYLRQNEHGSVHGRDLQRALEQESGRNLDRFFQDWILSAGHPELDVALGESGAELLTVAVKQVQTGDNTTSVFHVTLPLEVVYEDGQVQKIDLPIKERERTWAIPTRSAVRTVRVDPHFDLLAVVTLSGPFSWLETLARDEAPVMAVRALRALAKNGSRSARAVVARVLQEGKTWPARAEAAAWLARWGGVSARDALLAQLQKEDVLKARVAVIRALGSFESSAVVADGLLAELERTQPTWHVLGELLTSLGKTRDARAVDALRSHLGTSSWTDLVTQRALHGLAATRDPAVLPDLLEHLQGAHDDRIVAAAAGALATLGDVVPEVRRTVREALLRTLAEGGFRVRLATVRALGVLSDAAALPALRSVHQSDPDGRVRRTAYEVSQVLARGRTSEEGLASLRQELVSLSSAYQVLRERLDRLEPLDD